MIYLGKIQSLQVGKLTENGAYLYSPNTCGESEHKPNEQDPSELPIDRVLLPKNQLSEGLTPNTTLEVFIYRDSEDRPIATIHKPALTLGQVARLTVRELSKFGAFLDWGLPKDLLLPFKEQTFRPAVHDSVLAALYIDKSKRLCATMKVYNFLKTNSPYQKEDRVKGMIYEVLPNFGAFVAVDDCYSALIPTKELFRPVHPGEEIEARVTKVHSDGKLDLSIREKSYVQMDEDSLIILKALEQEPQGMLPYHDKSDPELIRNVFGLSKNAFKRAVGHLLKEGKITIHETGIRLKAEE